MLDLVGSPEDRCFFASRLIMCSAALEHILEAVGFEPRTSDPELDPLLQSYHETPGLFDSTCVNSYRHDSSTGSMSESY